MMAPFQVAIRGKTPPFPSLSLLMAEVLEWGARAAPGAHVAGMWWVLLADVSFSLSLQHRPRHSSWYKGRHWGPHFLLPPLHSEACVLPLLGWGCVCATACSVVGVQGG